MALTSGRDAKEANHRKRTPTRVCHLPCSSNILRGEGVLQTEDLLGALCSKDHTMQGQYRFSQNFHECRYPGQSPHI